MDIRLTNVLIDNRYSVDSTAFYATLMIDHITAGFAGNGGRGLPTRYRPANLTGMKLIKRAKVFCSGMPPKKISADDPAELPQIIPMTLGIFIDGLVAGILKTAAAEIEESGFWFGEEDAGNSGTGARGSTS